MAFINNANENEWELSKENVLPLKQGRNFSDLSERLSSSMQSMSVKETRRSFEEELRSYSGDDPLDVWDRYVKWTEQNFPTGGKESNIRQILERCVAEFKDESKYTNDARYLSMWLKYAETVSDKLVIYKYLYTSGIGNELAIFYDTWATNLEAAGNLKKADIIYTLGINKAAQPLELLKKRHSEFLQRMAKSITSDEMAESGSVDEAQETRSTLGDLKARGKHTPATRIGDVKQAPKGHLGTTKPLQTSNTNTPAFQVYTDDEQSSSGGVLPHAGQYAGLPSHKDDNENTSKPGPWNKAKMKQRAGAHASQSVNSTPCFSVHEDDLPQPMVTPRKVATVEHVLSAKKPEKASDLYQSIQKPSAAAASSAVKTEIPMYNKGKVFAGVQEFQFEELRSVYWRKKQEEMHKRQQEEEQRQTELRQQMEAMLEAQKRKMETEMEKKMEVLNQQFLQQLNMVRTDLETNRSANRNLNFNTSKNSTPDSGISSGHHSIHISQEADTALPTSDACFVRASPADVSLNTTSSSGSLRRMANHSTSFRSFSQEPSACTPSLDSSVNPATSGNLSMNATASGGSLRPSANFGASQRSTAFLREANTSMTPSSEAIITPGQSANVSLNMTASGGSLRGMANLSASLRSTSFGSGGITAPSPTINTKLACQAIEGLFSNTTLSANALGIDASIMHAPDHDDFEARFLTRDAEPFTVYDEMATGAINSKPVASGAFGVNTVKTSGLNSQPFEIYDEQQPTSQPEPAKQTFQIYDENQAPQQAFEIFDENQISKGKSVDTFSLSERPAIATGNQKRAALGQKMVPCSVSSEPDVHTGIAVMADQTQVIASAEHPYEEAMETGFDPGEVTFAPGISSTRNFSEIARLASTPFNPSGEMFPLPPAPVSNIKPGTSMPPRVNETSQGPSLIDRTDTSQTTHEASKEESSMKTRRSSMFGGQAGVNNLSPIMEQSDEDGQVSVSQHNKTAQHNISPLAAEQPALASTLINTKYNAVDSIQLNGHKVNQNTTHPEYNVTTSLNFTAATGHSSKLANSHFAETSLVNKLGHSQMSAIESVSDPVQTVSLQRADSPPPVPSCEAIGDMTCHIIDTTNYSSPNDPPDLNMSVAIDPHDPFDEDLIKAFLKRLSQPIETHPNYHRIDGNVPSFSVGSLVTLGDAKYLVNEKLGEGGFAKVYTCEACPDSAYGDMDIDVDTQVVKVQKPACPWEFYICNELHGRLAALKTSYDVRACVMNIEDGYFFNDGSCLFNQQHRNGTLLALVNLYRKQNQKIPSFIIIYITIELLRIIEQLHACHIIHGDVKPDNLLIRDLPRIEPGKTIKSLLDGQGSRMLKLIDFGRSIDMRMFPHGTTFTASVQTSGFQCIEMKTNLPWTYQTDHFGVAGTACIMLTKEYMKVICNAKKWDISCGVRRYWPANEAWKSFFHDLLNIKSCDEQPDLAALRGKLEDHLLNSPDVTAEKFNHAMEQLEITLYKAK